MIKPLLSSACLSFSCTFILWMFLPVHALTQDVSADGTVYINKFNDEAGLRQSMVKQVLKDSRGYMWVVTGDGLHLFDGKKFRAFRPASIYNWESDENIMRQITELEPGIFVITTSSSILLFNSLTCSFEKIMSQKYSYPVLLPVKAGYGLMFWFPIQGFFFMDKHQLINLHLQFSETATPPDDFIPFSALLQKKGNLLISGSQGIIELELPEIIKSPVVTAYWTPTPKTCVSMVSDSLNETFVLTGNKIYIYKDRRTMKPYADVALSEPSSMSIANGKVFWISEKGNKNLTRFANNRVQNIHLLESSGKHTDTIKPYIIFSWIDERNNLWLGTDGDGLLRHSPEVVQFFKALTGFSRGITSDKNSNLWVGTFKNGLWKLSPDLSRMRRVYPDLINDHVQVNDLHFDAAGRLWLVTNEKLLVLNPEGTPILSYPFHALFSRFIVDNDTTIYITTNHYTYTFDASALPGLLEKKPNNFIHTSLTCNGMRWIGTQAGLFVCDESEGFGIEHLIASNCLLNTSVEVLANIDNQIWASTGYGIKIFGPDIRELEAPAVFEELRNETIYAFIPDDLGRVWISLSKGLACVSRQRDKIFYFDYSNNLQGLEFNSNAWHVSSKGMIYWGGINGINGIDPAQFSPDRKGAEALLTELQFSDTLFAQGLPPKYLPEKKISWKAPHFSGKVISDDYSGHEYKFSFFLVNYDKDWNSASEQNFFQYRNLPSGKYKLLVKCQDEYDNWGQETELLSIHVTAPFWKTRRFIISFILLLVLSNTLIIRQWQAIRYKRKIKELEHQNALEKERLRISRDLHDELGSGLSLIILNASLTRQSIEDPRLVENHLNRIYRNARDLYENMNNLIWLLKQDTHTLEILVIKIREMVAEMLSEAVDEYVIQVPEFSESIEVSREFSRNLFMITKEAVNNAVKHAQSSRIELIIEIVQEGLLFQIIDNGKGFDMQNIRQGNGLQNMKLRAGNLGGHCSVISSPGNGTQISIFFPLIVS